ncbi:MAG: type II toxin-antitoxin system YafQ family toxin [Deltaproteobacteria bacterium]|nr:type II toxin-antitoxin system YafQ family toxin [Deltaproteobacteria bacterium]
MKVYQTKNFKKHYKVRVSEQDKKTIETVIEKFLKKEPLESKFKDHNLSGNMNGFRECHIKNDFLLVYQISNSDLILIDIGTHSQLFK